MENIDNKSYVRKTFVLDKSLVEKLSQIAKKENRSLNWVVKNILLDFFTKKS